MRFLLLLIMITAPALQADDGDFPGVEKLMSAEQFEASGMHKLSPSELEALNDWLVNYTVDDAQALRHTSEEVRKAEETIRIESSVKAPFKGWNGKTLFVLENGQVWKQRLKGRFFYSGEDRRIVIEKNFFGYFKLTHVASGKSVGVSRYTE
ncbi:MAG: hypothetical protein ACK5ME_09255 [Parahaliea sp.]